MKKFAAFIVSVYMLAAMQVTALEVPITVSAPPDAKRTTEVVSGGIPMPMGAYKEDSTFSLYKGNSEIPVQISSIVKYPDESLHWALVSFPVDINAGDEEQFILRDRPGRVTPDNPVTVQEKDNKVLISNGIVAFIIDKEQFNGFEAVAYRNKTVFKNAEAGLAANGQGPGKVTHFEYRYRGPVRTTVYMKGTYGELKAPTWSMAITLNANENIIHIDHNLRNGGKGASKMDVQAPKLCLGLTAPLKQTESESASGNKPSWGWHKFSGAADLLVFQRAGGQGTPLYKAEVKDKELQISMGFDPNGDVNLHYGAHKITEIDLVFGDADPAALALPLHARASSDWYAAHDSMGVGRGFGSLEDETATYKNQGWKNAEEPKKLPRKKNPVPNMYKSSFDAHRTSECDQMRGLTLGYVRTGQRGFLDRSHAWARYWQTFFLYRSDDLIYGKDMSYNTPKWGRGRCCTEGCHFYVAGLFNYALLTGDIDALEAAFDGAEFVNKGWFGQYSRRSPGKSFSTWGSRGFARCYLGIARAYDVARNEMWKDTLLHFARMARQTPMLDPRGFTICQQGSSAKSARGKAKGIPELDQMIAEQNIKIDGKHVVHPVYGRYLPKYANGWPMVMLSWGNYQAWESLSADPDPEAQLAAEDALDLAVATAEYAVRYVYHDIQKAMLPSQHMDYPIPDYVARWSGGKWNEYQPKGTDSWYTKWWPNTLAQGYMLTGDEYYLDTMYNTIWWGLARFYRGAPKVPEGEAPPYADVNKNTKGDWVTPTALAFGVGSGTRKDSEPPAAVKDLKARTLGDGKVEVAWSTPSDKGGKVARYQVKWAQLPIVDFIRSGDEYRKRFKDGKLQVEYWNTANNVLGEPEPGRAGKAERMTLKLEPGTTCHIAVRSFDDSRNRSPVSNVVSVEVK